MLHEETKIWIRSILHASESGTTFWVVFPPTFLNLRRLNVWTFFDSDMRKFDLHWPKWITIHLEDSLKKKKKKQLYSWFCPICARLMVDMTANNSWLGRFFYINLLAILIKQIENYYRVLKKKKNLFKFISFVIVAVDNLIWFNVTFIFVEESLSKNLLQVVFFLNPDEWTWLTFKIHTFYFS